MGKRRGAYFLLLAALPPNPVLNDVAFLRTAPPPRRSATEYTSRSVQSTVEPASCMRHATTRGVRAMGATYSMQPSSNLCRPLSFWLGGFLGFCGGFGGGGPAAHVGEGPRAARLRGAALCNASERVSIVSLVCCLTPPPN
jgi:hypothetical protein